MSEVILLIGAPGSGKSTWAKNNSDNYFIASTDNIIEQWGKEVGMKYHEAFEHFDFNKANTKMNKEIKQAVKDNKSVIIDRTNMTVKGRAKFLKMFPSSYKKIAVVFENDYETLKARLIKREKETGKHVPAFVLTNMLNNYQQPTKEEGFDNLIFFLH